MVRHLPTLGLAVILLGATGCVTSTSLSPGGAAESAPVASPRGWLLIVGGGGTTDDMVARAIALGGGVASQVLVFPQASERPDAGETCAALWRESGAAEVRVGVPQNESGALELVAWASIIWFPGGVQSRLMDALGPALRRAIDRRYREGAVVGGTSAGGAVMSGVMITGEIEGAADDGSSFVRAQTVETKPGLGLIDWAIIDQHFVRRRRFNRLLSCVLDHPNLVGIGIDERTAILVHGGGFEVLGESQVFVLDARDSRAVQYEKGMPSAAAGMRLGVLTRGMTYAVGN